MPPPNARTVPIKLYLLGKNEIFGMEEIVDMSALRAFTVTCASTVATCYVLTKEHFQDCVNQFRFSDCVIEELMLKHRLFKERVMQTHVFLKNYFQEQ